MKNCCIVIPLYKEFNKLNDFEKKSFNNYIEKLTRYDICIVCPQNLKTDKYENYGIKTIKFENSFFKNIYEYNDLMLNTSFYEKFSNYEYILISQLDAYVFNDKLEYFIDLGYDYIGSLHYTPHTQNKLINGNGGLSLRKVSSFIEASEHIKEDLNNRFDWEDILYSYWYKDKLNIAPYEVSLKFGWQQDPQKCFEENNNELPFGCHKPFVFDKENKIYKIK